jgi:predicted type IV restriction endonuclease
MNIVSPVGSLIEIIKQVVKSSAEYEKKLFHNEAATRAALIDPNLRGLGWDTANPNMVEFERNFKDLKLDYAFYDSAGKVRLIVEAKSLGGNLNDTKVMFSLVSYCLTAGISNLFLTNGIVWQHFTNLQPGNINPITVDFLKDPLINCARYLIDEMDAAQFWTVDIKPVETWKPEQMQKTAKAALLNQPSSGTEGKKAVSVAAEKKPAPELPPSQNYVLLTALEANLKGKPAPTSLLLPDGSTRAIKYWRDILAETVIFTLQNNPDISIPLSDKAGKKIYLLNTTLPDQKIAYLQTMYNDQTIYVHLNYDSNHCVENALYILGFVPEDRKLYTPGVLFA